MITKYLAIIRTSAGICPIYGRTLPFQTCRVWQFPSLRLYIRVGKLS